MERESDRMNRVGLVTGSSAGIGLGIAKSLASRGHAVILTGRRQDLLESHKEQLSRDYGVTVHVVLADLSQREDIERLCATVKQLYPSGIDILVNNAGVQHASPIEDFSLDAWDKLLQVNLTAPFMIIQKFLPDMKKKGWGRIVNISSIYGLVSQANKSAYVSSKHGLNGLTKTVALEAAEYGVTCNSICPGGVDTEILIPQFEAYAKKLNVSSEEAKARLVEQLHPTKKFVAADDIGELAAFLCSDAASQMTGTVLPMDGGCVAR